MGGTEDHWDAGGHGIPEALVQQGLDVAPGPLHRGIAKELLAHHIGGEHHGTGELGQHAGQGCLAAGGRADQQVAAQGRWQGHGRESGKDRSLAAAACNGKPLHAKEQMQIQALKGVC